MPHLFSFTTARFDIANETPNPINPIPGESVLNWLRPVLQASEYTSTDPATEDWGWYMDARRGETKYMIGASGEAREGSSKVDWVVQLHIERSAWEKLTGKNKLLIDDALSALIESTVRAQADFEELSVEKKA